MTREAILEGILFAMGGSVEREQLAEAMEITPEEVEAAAAALKAKYEEEDRGIRLIRLASKPKQPVLTDVVRETLAIIAYKQPVTKGDIERIRGVSSDHAVNRLVEFGLVEEKGRLNAPGRPILFGTTEEFLRRFQIEGCEVLPELDPDQLAEIEAQVESETAKAEAAEREEQEKIQVEI